MADFTVLNAHIGPIIRLIQADMNDSDWELILNDMLKPQFRHDILRETHFAIRILRTLETWVSCTETHSKKFSHLISFIEDNGRIRLAETLRGKASELAAIK